VASSVSPTSFASLSDLAGRLFVIRGRLIRLIHKSSVPKVHAFLNSRAAREFTESGRFVPARILDHASREELCCHRSFSSLLENEESEMVVEHESVPFPHVCARVAF